MNEAVPETYILSVPGTDQTQELPRSVVLDKIAKGEITLTDWVWSPPDQDWKMVSEIPSLQPPVKKSILGPLGPIGKKQKEKAEPQLSTPPIVPLPKKKVKKVKPRRTKDDSDDDETSGLGKVVSVLVVLLFAALGVNYVFLDKPLHDELAKTPFILVPAHAHMGAFFQPDKLVIHVIPTNELSADNFAEFLATLANSTPPPPFTGKTYTVVELTPGWRGEYAFTGDDWTKLGQMTSSSAEAQKNFILEQIDDPTGQKLVGKTPSGDVDVAARDRVWQQMTAAFHAEGAPGGNSLASVISTVTTVTSQVSSITSKVQSFIPRSTDSTNTDGGTGAPAQTAPAPTNAPTTPAPSQP